MSMSTISNSAANAKTIVNGGKSTSFPPEFDAYVARTQSWLDLLALSTIWLVLAIFTGQKQIDLIPIWLVCRLAISVVYLVDLIIRSRLSGRGLRYAISRPDLMVAVIIPPVRIFASMRLLRKLFSRGNLALFMTVALILMLNAAVVVWEFESRAPGANITTLGNALWWSVVTVTTVGYGDYTPVTLGGRLTAVALLVLGLVSLAVLTAQIASNFLEQGQVAQATPDAQRSTSESN
jgi:voltage-gated potassium channel